MLEASDLNITAELRLAAAIHTPTRLDPVMPTWPALLPAPTHEIWPECSLWRCSSAGSGFPTFIFNGACPSWQRRLLQQPATEKKEGAKSGKRLKPTA